MKKTTGSPVKTLKKGEPREVYLAAQAVIDEYRDHFMKAVELIIKKAERNPRQWSFVNGLICSLRVDAISFKGLAVKDKTANKLLEAGFRAFGCQRCGRRRWRDKGTDCKPCNRQFWEAMDERDKERLDFVIR